MSSDENPDVLVVEDLAVAVSNKPQLIHINLRLEKGEIHSLFGDETEQRITFLKVLAGEVQRSVGRMWFENKTIQKHSTRKATKLGIEFIDRSRKSFLNLTVLENIFSERLLRKSPFMVDRKGMRKRAEDFFEGLSIGVDLDVPLSTLSHGQRRLVEIARSICSHPKLLLIDESLIDEIKIWFKPEIIDKLYYIFTVLARGGTTILYNSNSMDHIFKFANRVSIMKNGSIFKTTLLSDIDKMQLVQLTYSSILSRRELEESNFELFYTKQIYEGIINSLPFPMLVTDTKRNVVVVNEAAEKLFHARSESVFCRPLHEILMIDEAIIVRLQEELLTKSKTEFQYLAGVYQDVNVFVFPIMDEVESSMGMLFVFSKLNSTIDLEREIRANADRYNSEYRIAKIVHEVNNPLGIMLNHLRLIRTEQSIDHIRDNALSIEREVERICRLLEKLKKKEETAKPGRGVRKRTSWIVREIAELLAPIIEKNKIKLNIKYEHDSIMPHDPDLIRQVMLNIVLNGIEAMKEGGELNIICKKLINDGKELLVIEVNDKGIGIPKKDLEKIFEPFYTTKQDRNSSGMGLSISREIVHSLDGYITVNSIPTQGSTFSIFLPMNSRRNQSILKACP